MNILILASDFKVCIVFFKMGILYFFLNRAFFVLIHSLVKITASF